ncbi:MAG TPA: S9 family peptidase [Ohtaekwangia sp.]|nr:S9 family peptidase [Ohtaekwangia sp.]
MKRSILFLCLVINLTAIGQQKISVADFTTEETFHAKTVSGINWMKDGKFYSTLKDNKIVKYNITTGELVETMLDGNALTPALEIESYSLNADESKILINTETRNIYRRSFVAEYYVYDIPSRSLKKLSANGKQSYATISPDGLKIAFVRENNLYYVTLADMKETKVTDDGKFNAVINGTTDWVYEEEFGFVKGFFWSPDSKRLAYYRFDESHVKEYTMQVWRNKLYPKNYTFKYPKAGEANSFVEIWFYDIATAQKVRADLETERDVYIPRITWTTNPAVLSVRKMNRLQNKLELIHTEASTGKSKVILTEESKTYIDVRFVEDLVYLNDGKHFITPSEASGFIHLYLYTIEGSLVHPITKGSFEVQKFLGLNPKTNMLYYTSTEVSPLEKHLYTISIKGNKKKKLSEGSGVHKINMSTDFQFYIDHYSHANQPPQASLYETKSNKRIKILEKNDSLLAETKRFNFAAKEFFTFKSAGTDSLRGYFLKPNDFIAGKKYPVLVYQYSGPGSQNVNNSWAGSHYYFHQMLTQHGYIVAVVDTRGTGARGVAFKKATYKQLGKLELEDIIQTAEYLSTLPFVDDKRLGVWGWSYGGYITALALTKGAGTYKMGIAVSPVTNWRFYDTVYTERYLQTPQLNASGYDDNSPVQFADKFEGDLLLVHGTGDDNVHLQNSIVFQNALINAGKQFTSFFYPDKHHGIQGSETRHHLYTMMFQYVSEHL